MADKTMKFGEAPEEQKNEILEKMREHGIMLPNINAWGYDKAVAKVEALIAAKTAQNKPETPDKPETEPEESENKEADKTENVQNVVENVENSDETPETPEKTEAETPAEEIKEEKKPHYDGLCHICRSAVYDGVCSGCGFTLRR